VFALLLLAATARAEGDRAGEARRHFQAGTRAYAAGRFSEALHEFEAANRIKADPALLYDLGQTHHALGHSAEALSFYRAYVDTAAYAANRDEVLGKIEAIEKELKAREKEQARVESQVSQAERRAREAEEARRAADELSLKAQALMTEAEAARTAAREAQDRAQRVLQQNKVPIYKRWWLWTGLALVVAGGVTAAVLLTQPTTPHTSQGNFDF
jgi:hypothetical protein